MSNRDFRDESGFTLIEIVVVVAILALFVGVIYSSFFGTIRAMRATEELKDSFQSARVIMQHIQRDLKGAMHVPNDPRFLFKGTDEYEGDSEGDRLDFVTCSHIITEDDAPQSDLSEVSYYIDKSNYLKRYLVRREDIYPDTDPDKGGKLRIVGEDVVGLNFKYYRQEKQTAEELQTDAEREEEKKTVWEYIADPENWHDEWDWEEHPYLPKMVRVELTLLEKTGKETTFSTVVYLNRDEANVSAAQAAASRAEAEEEQETTGSSQHETRGRQSEWIREQKGDQ